MRHVNAKNKNKIEKNKIKYWDDIRLLHCLNEMYVAVIPATDTDIPTGDARYASISM